jgi:hypothetical protein
VHLLRPPFSWFPFVFNEKREVRTYWNLLSSGWGCDTYLATAHPKGPVHLFGVLFLPHNVNKHNVKRRRRRRWETAKINGIRNLLVCLWLIGNKPKVIFDLRVEDFVDIQLNQTN